MQGQGSRLAFTVIPKAHYAPHHLLYFRMLGRHGMNALLLEGIADTGEPPHQGGGFSRLPVAQLPLPLLFIQPYPVGQYTVSLIRQKVHDVVMGCLQRIQPMQLAPEYEDTSVCLIGIEGGIRFCAAQETPRPAIERRIEYRLQ